MRFGGVHNPRTGFFTAAAHSSIAGTTTKNNEGCVFPSGGCRHSKRPSALPTE